MAVVRWSWVLPVGSLLVAGCSVRSASPPAPARMAPPPIDTVGPLVVAVVYPPIADTGTGWRARGPVASRDSTFIFGSSGRGDASLTVNGVDVPVYPNGAWIAWVSLPDDTVVWPGHDYRGNTSTTIGEQKVSNPRLAGKTREQYIEVMNNLGLPVPVKVQQVLQVNQSGYEAHEVLFPAYEELVACDGMDATTLAEELAGDNPPLVIDVREPEEFVGELGHIGGAILVPMDALPLRLPKLAGFVDREIVVVCRSGVRSASVTAILQRAGFQRASNLEGGMLAWARAGLDVQH